MLPELGLQLRAIDLSPAIRCLITSRKSFACMCCIKSWCNAWTTSTRMHDALQMQCLFGCKGEKDSIQHYLQCERLWNTVFQQLRISPFDDVLERLAIKNPSKEKVTTLAVVFVIYHKTRARARKEGVQLILNAAEAREYARAAASLVQM